MIIKIKSEFIKISQLLKFSKIINTGGEIKKFLEDNHVTLNGKKITSRSSKVKYGDIVWINENSVLNIEEDE
ncbi:RNA-binding S4 domain-containing protein [Mycoplasmopsis cynos]|uniref:RNA-binding S4 domain-containing protein n=1 Tax=Mycoplasmopsis cynos TaxID=171284 RepID=UPI0024CBAF34|nr:RNA-binding S4 domain-containing protein [Mycoplasmopsis cynos]WAM07095.1 RNA-binding S4 domain-containing protein [Mycoplasmopsis cynos]WAM09305.1 RNA-binding S4 domain-containing protein [Mycoplasmopsis cynos]